MKQLCLLIGMFAALAGVAWAQEEYPLSPDSQRQPGVPQGKVTQYTWSTSKVYPGTVRDYWVYVPAQYTADKPACLMVFLDGKSFMREDGRARIPIVFDNLIAKHEMPETIAILIDPGVVKAVAPGQGNRLNRSFEYDSLGDRYARFLLDEILPEVAKQYNFSTNPDDRAIGGSSSGTACAFTVAWTHPEAFHRVLSFIGTFTDLRGADIYPVLIRKTEPKPLRVFLQDGSHDLNIFAGNWFLGNQSMASALEFDRYDYKFVTGDKNHDMIQGGAIMPDALRWLWRDYPQPIARPELRHLGDPITGRLDMDPNWELVSLGNASAKGSPPSPLKDAAGIAVDEQGNVFCRQSSGKGIYRIDLDGHASTFGADAEGSNGLAFGPEGRLFGCDREGIVSYASDGEKTVRLPHVACKDIAVTHAGGIYFTESFSGKVGYLAPSKLTWDPNASTQPGGLGDFKANGLRLTNDQSLLYVSDPASRWVWCYQVQADGSLAAGEPFLRMESLDESTETGEAGMTTDKEGLVYVTSLMGIQIFEGQGRGTTILNWPEKSNPFTGPALGVAFGGRDHQYLYIVVGNEVFRRRAVKKPFQP